MSFQDVALQIEVMAWRDNALTAISDQLEKNFPALVDDLTAQVDQLSISDLTSSAVSLTSTTEKMIEDWYAKQMQEACHHAKQELEKTLQNFSGELSLARNTWDQLSSALPAALGVGLIGDSVPAIPTVISLATVGSSVLAFWATSTISLPLLAVGMAGIGITSAVGAGTLKYAEGKARDFLKSKLTQESAQLVFGISENPKYRSVLHKIQAIVVQQGQERIKERAMQ